MSETVWFLGYRCKPAGGRQSSDEEQVLLADMEDEAEEEAREALKKLRKSGSGKYTRPVLISRRRLSLRR